MVRLQAGQVRRCLHFRPYKASPSLGPAEVQSCAPCGAPHDQATSLRGGRGFGVSCDELLGRVPSLAYPAHRV